jgi:hypothetical protein
MFFQTKNYLQWISMVSFPHLNVYSRIYHQNGSFLDDFQILEEDPTLTRPCVYTYGMIWVDGHIYSWFTHKNKMIFRSFLYFYQRVYVLYDILYIYICKDTLTLILLLYRMVYPHTQDATVAMYSDPRRWQCGNVGWPPQMIWLRWKMVEKYLNLNKLRFMVNLLN